MQALRRVDYLQDAPEDLLTDIAFNMEAETLEKGVTIFNVDDISSIMMVVFSGLIEIISVMDNGTEFPIERLGRGSIVNAHSFLIEDKLDAIARCGTTSTIYVLSSDKFLRLIQNFPGFSDKITVLLSQQIANRENAIALDYI